MVHGGFRFAITGRRMRFEMSLKPVFAITIAHITAGSARSLCSRMHLVVVAGNGEALESRHHPWRSPVAGAGGAQWSRSVNRYQRAGL